jgi:threonine dehydrogenase-like Zn-dependent dehydrogenase
MAIASSIFLGAKLVYAVDCVEERLKIAKEFGATTIDFVKCDPVNKIKELTDGRGADVVLEVRNNFNKNFGDFYFILIKIYLHISMYIFF